MANIVDFAHLDPIDSESGTVRAVIETPGGSRNKYKFDEQLGLFTIDRVLPLGAAFPFDFGFIPRTRGEDGDPLDVLVFMEEPACTGCVLPVRLIGVLEAEQSEGSEFIRNDRLLAVLDTKDTPAKIQSLSELPPGQLDEIEHFFRSYNRWAGREFRVLGRKGPEVARELLKQSMKGKNKKNKKGKLNGSG